MRPTSEICRFRLLKALFDTDTAVTPGVKAAPLGGGYHGIHCECCECDSGSSVILRTSRSTTSIEKLVPPQWCFPYGKWLLDGVTFARFDFSVFDMFSRTVWALKIDKGLNVTKIAFYHGSSPDHLIPKPWCFLQILEGKSSRFFRGGFGRWCFATASMSRRRLHTQKKIMESNLLWSCALREQFHGKDKRRHAPISFDPKAT